MAQTFFQVLLRFRFLLVAGLVMAFLSTPFLTEAGTKQSSTISIVEAPSSVAGMSSEITLQGNPFENIEVAIKKPDNSTLLLDSVTDDKGKAQLTISDYHLRQAGNYQVSARNLDKNEGYGATSTFEVYAGSVSETKSSTEFTKNSAQTGETVEMTVTLQDSYENKIDGHVLKVIPSTNSASVYTKEFATDQNGQMHFFITSNKNGIYTFSLFDSSVNKTLTQKPKLAFSGSGDFADVGGYNSVVLAESGSVASLSITGLESTMIVGKDTTVTVKAIDDQGFTVSDYTGSIRFSSTDSEATLPSDYTFLAEDQGEHSFSLAVKFVTPGAQTLSVTDTDKTSIKGSAGTTVATAEEAAVDYGSTFETTDYTREGDFTLISPAAGTYSTNTVEVQGEAEYGYTAFIYINDEIVGHADVEFDNSFTFSLQELEDGDYKLYVEIVEINIANPSDYTDEEIDTLYGDGQDPTSFTLIETSDTEKITIDTTAPELVSVATDATDETALEGGQEVTVTILSEADLEEATVLFQDEIYTLDETSTSGKYEVTIPMPAAEGAYTMDVLLMDSLGNEVQYSDQLTLTVAKASTDTTTETPVEVVPTETVTTAIGVPTGLSATGSEEEILLSWEAPESTNSIAFYRIYYGPSKESLYAISETYDSSTNWSIVDLTGEQLYYFAVAAIDVEGTEGEMSDVVLGVPLLSSVAVVVDEIPDTSSTPAITGSEDEITATPESGPAQNALLMLSATGAMIAMGIRKRRASTESF